MRVCSNYFVIHELWACKNSFSTYVCYTLDVLFWWAVYVFKNEAQDFSSTKPLIGRSALLAQFVWFSSLNFPQRKSISEISAFYVWVHVHYSDSSLGNVLVFQKLACSFRFVCKRDSSFVLTTNFLQFMQKVVPQRMRISYILDIYELLKRTSSRIVRMAEASALA